MTKEKVQFIREWLDKLVASERLENDDREDVYDKAQAVFEKDDILALIDQAAGKNKKRKTAALFLLAFFDQLPEVKARFLSLLNDDNQDVRYEAIGFLARYSEAGPLLSQVILNETDIGNLGAAIFIAGDKKIPECLPAILDIAKKYPLEKARAPIVVALQRYGDLRGKDYLQKIFNDLNVIIEIRDFAAWGLAKMQDDTALDYLIERLYRDDEFRAAQALCDIFNWEFKWNLHFIASHKEDWKIKLKELRPGLL